MILYKFYYKFPSIIICIILISYLISFRRDFIISNNIFMEKTFIIYISEIRYVS